jgi:hypothetical protein
VQGEQPHRDQHPGRSGRDLGQVERPQQQATPVPTTMLLTAATMEAAVRSICSEERYSTGLDLVSRRTSPKN